MSGKWQKMAVWVSTYHKLKIAAAIRNLSLSALMDELADNALANIDPHFVYVDPQEDEKESKGA